MSTNNGAMSTLDLLSFDMDLNDTDGFAGGEVSYFLDGIAGTFIFSDANYNAIYNMSSISDGMLTLSIWGGDEINDLGLDMGLTAEVPEPGVLMLLLIGMVAMKINNRANFVRLCC